MKNKFKDLKKESFDIPELEKSVLEYGISKGNQRQKKGLNIHIKARYVVMACLFLFTMFLIIDDNIEYNYSYEDDNTIYTVDSKRKLSTIIKDSKKQTEKRQSLIDRFTALYACKAMEEDGANWDSVDENNNPTDSVDGSYSQTNTQEQNIDESDIVKTNGKYIFVVRQNHTTMYIYEVDGENTDLVKGIRFSYSDEAQLGSSNELYLTDKYIVLINSYLNKSKERKVDIYLYDINTFNLSKSFSFNGNFISSRLYNNHLYLITNDVIKENKAPYYYENGEEVDVDYEDVLYMKYSEVTTYAYVIAISLETLEVDVETQLGGSNLVIYMSENYLYIVTQLYNYNIRQVCSSIFVYTVDGFCDIFGGLKIDGSVDDQWHLSEYNNRLRIAYENIYSEDSNKINKLAVYEIDKEKKEFNLVGFLDEGIGLPNQNIYSVLFDGDIVNIVTYEQKDPLYKIELVNGVTPIIKSKLETPGYSDYMKKVTFNGVDYLVGFGMTDYGTLKISLYLNGEEVTQVGENLVFPSVYSSEVFSKSSSLFCWIEEDKAYFGIPADGQYYDEAGTYTNIEYILIEVNLNNEKPLTVISISEDDRCVYIDGYFYLIDVDKYTSVTVKQFE